MAWLAWFLMLAAGAFAAGPPRQFTAEAVTQTVGRAAIRGRIYVDNGKMRMDVEGAQPLRIIMIPARNQMYMVDMRTRTFRDVPLPAANRHNAYMPDAKSTLLLSEMVRGIHCDKYEVKSGPSTYYFWVRKGTSLPVQMETADGQVHVEYRQVTLGAPPPKTFSVPTGFKKR
jgi:hypothetical protein